MIEGISGISQNCTDIFASKKDSVFVLTSRDLKANY